MDKQECIDILDRYENWNEGQTSVPFAFRGIRTREDDILDAKRELILEATKQLKIHLKGRKK